jgi:hypothetical protein
MTQRPTAATTAVLYDGRSAEMLVGYAEDVTGALHTLQFEETRADTGETGLLLRFDWERRAHPGAALVMPEAGQPMQKLDEYWLMWRQGDWLFAQSAQRPQAIASALVEDEWLIDRPLVAGNKELHQYAWRGGCLVRHRFGGKRESIRVETLMELGSRPARTMCAPLPGDNDGTALVAFVGEAGGNIAATALYVRSGKVMPMEGSSEGRYRLMARHRMGIHVGKKARPAVALMTESHGDGSYALLEARFDFGKKECSWKRTKLEGVAPGRLETAGVFYFKTQDAPDPFVLAVDKAGRLLWPRRRLVTVVREDAGLDYAYPILTTAANRYEAVGSGMEIALRRL